MRPTSRAMLLPGAVTLTALGALGAARSSILPAGARDANTLAAADSPVVTWTPERPAQGTLFTVRVEPGSVPLQVVTGELAGEPLHFRPVVEGGAWAALAAAPMDADDEMELRLLLKTVGEAPERRVIAVATSRGEYRLERLTVAPEFGRPQPPEIQARIREESARAMAVSRRSHETPRMWEPPFLAPRESRITSGFGHGREFNGQVQSRHMGTDYAGAVGAPVRAPARGRVALVDAFYLGGNVVYLDHGAGLVTAYLHLSAREVEEGEVVERGRVIGRVGATGRVTGPHLHWIVRYGEVSVDGLSLLALE